MLEEAEYSPFLSINTEFREKWAIRFLFSNLGLKIKSLEMFNPYQM